MGLQALGPGGGRRKVHRATGGSEKPVRNSALERAGISQRRRKRDACARCRGQVTCCMAGTLGALGG